MVLEEGTFLKFGLLGKFARLANILVLVDEMVMLVYEGLYGSGKVVIGMWRELVFLLDGIGGGYFCSAVLRQIEGVLLSRSRLKRGRREGI